MYFLGRHQDATGAGFDVDHKHDVRALGSGFAIAALVAINAVIIKHGAL